MSPLRLSILATALGCGLMAGVFFAFSTFVMAGLSRLPATKGIAAMQSINLAVMRSPFLAVFMVTALACLGLVVFAFLRIREPWAGYVLAGSLLYLVGTFLVTVVFNVPLNDGLTAVEVDKGAEFWAAYLQRWSLWNHVRTGTSLLGLAVLVLGLLRAD